MHHTGTFLSALLAFSFFSSCTTFNTASETTQQPDPQEEEIKRLTKSGPSRPSSLSKPAYYLPYYNIKYKLNEWLKYFAYYEKNPQSTEPANIYESENDEETPLMLAAALGNIRIMKELLQHGVNINFTSKHYHETALHYAAYKGNTEAYAFLVKNGAKQDIKSIDASSTSAKHEDDCECFTVADDVFREKRNFKLRTPKQLLQKRLSDALTGKYDGDED